MVPSYCLVLKHKAVHKSNPVQPLNLRLVFRCHLSKVEKKSAIHKQIRRDAYIHSGELLLLSWQPITYDGTTWRSSLRECYRFLFSWGFCADFLTAVIQQWLVKIMLTYLKKKDLKGSQVHKCTQITHKTTGQPTNPQEMILHQPHLFL